MTTKDFRSALFAEIQTWGAASFPTLPIVYENGPVPDQEDIGPIWLDVEIRWYGGSLASIGTSPRTRQTGALSANCFYKDSNGTGQSDSIVDSLSAYLTARRVGGAILLAPQRTVPTHLQGWYKTGILLPFTLG